LAAGVAALLLVCSLGSPGRAAGLLIADGGFGGVLKIQEQDVQVTINNGVAVTEVSQVFLNTEKRMVEALYTFPVPNGASVSNFSMIINGKEMIGEVVEKQRARKIYESYKQKKRDPGLLEQVDYKRFEMRVFPIPAGAEQHVKVTYYQELDTDHDWATYVYPLETVSRPDADQRTTGKFALTLDVKSEIPITEMSSPSHGDDFVIVEHGAQYRRASLETHEGDLSRDVVIAYRVERPRTGIDVVTSKVSGEDGYFQLTLTAGKELEELSRGMDYVFVLDVSGSMAHDGKLRMSRNSIGAFVEALGPEDRFELITFNIAPDTLFNTLQSVTDEAKSEAVTYLESQRARGGTSLRPALTTAYRYRDADRTLNVVVLSDGMTEQREQRDLLELVRQRPSGSRVFCVGIGNEVNRPLLAQLADRAGGLAAFISQGDDFQRQAQAFRRKLMRPAVTLPKITLAGVDVYDVEPQTLPDLYHGSPLRVYGRYRNSGNLTARIDGDALGAPFEQSAEVALPKVDADNPEIERMWAWHRVQRLMDENRSSGNDTANVEEIVQLCEGYSIAGQYASFIVLENDGEYRRWKIDRRNASRIQRDRAARAAVRQRLDQLREQTLANLGPQDSAEASSDSPADATRVRTSRTPVAVRPPNVSNSVSTPRAPQSSGGSMGGGAIDPLTAAMALALIGAAAAATRRKRNNRRRN
jgi:Ca-activated chloride channel family protein